jgi:hypothetical protein
MSSEGEKSEQRLQLNRQQLTEWNDLLALEIRTRIALDNKHKQDSRQAYLDELNFRDRAVLATQQLQAIRDLAQQNRLIRITMQQRHTQENKDLTQKLGE